MTERESSLRTNVRPLAFIALLSVFLGIGFAACKDGDDDRTAGIVHRLLLAALAQDPDQLQSFPGELPPDLPADFPIYPDGDLVLSARELRVPQDAIEEPGAGDPVTALFLILIDTPDAPADVFSYYEGIMDEDPWQVESTAATTELQRVSFSLIADTDVTGSLDIARGRNDDRTTIVVSIQDAGAEQIEAPEFEVPDSLEVPIQFPDDVPIYDGAIITSAVFLREPAQESIELTFLTDDDQTTVFEFYRETFDTLGWDTEDVAGGGLGDRMVFNDTDNTLNGAIEVNRFADDRDYTQVIITLQQDSNREPDPDATPDESDGEETPES